MLNFKWFSIYMIYMFIFSILLRGFKNKIWINNLYGTLLSLIFF